MIMIIIYKVNQKDSRRDRVGKSGPEIVSLVTVRVGQQECGGILDLHGFA